MNILNEIKNRICWLCDICLELKYKSYCVWMFDEYYKQVGMNDDIIILEDEVMGGKND